MFDDREPAHLMAGIWRQVEPVREAKSKKSNNWGSLRHFQNKRGFCILQVVRNVESFPSEIKKLRKFLFGFCHSVIKIFLNTWKRNYGIIPVSSFLMEDYMYIHTYMFIF